MANRAYLYPSDSPEDWEKRDKNYWDSRHYIPMAWLFFYRSKDIHIVPIESWHKVTLSSNLEGALQLFRERRPIVERLLGNSFPIQRLLRLTDTLAKSYRPYLILEPSEILQDEDDGQAWLHNILRLIETGCCENEFWDACNPWAPSRETINQKPEVNVIGYTYPWDDNRGSVFYHRVVWPE
jgi:hypothetical protein